MVSNNYMHIPVDRLEYNIIGTYFMISCRQVACLSASSLVLVLTLQSI